MIRERRLVTQKASHALQSALLISGILQQPVVKVLIGRVAGAAGPDVRQGDGGDV